MCREGGRRGRAVAPLCVLGLWAALVACAERERSGGRAQSARMEVVFPPEGHVFHHADEVQLALLFDVESPEVCALVRLRAGTSGYAGVRWWEVGPVGSDSHHHRCRSSLAFLERMQPSSWR
jgi:hypothetical protein